MNCYLSRNYKGLGSAGNKAKTDMEKIMKDMNFRNVGLPQSISKTLCATSSPPSSVSSSRCSA